MVMAELGGGGPDPLRFDTVAQCDRDALGETPVIDPSFRGAAAIWEPMSTTGIHADSATTGPAPENVLTAPASYSKHHIDCAGLDSPRDWNVYDVRGGTGMLNLFRIEKLLERVIAPVIPLPW